MNLNHKKILIIRLSSLGDVILTSPVLREIKSKFPSVEIHFLVLSSFRDAILYNENISKVHVYNKKSDNIELINNLKIENFDYIFDLQNNRHSKRILSKLKVSHTKFIKPSVSKFLLVQTKINLLKPFTSIQSRYFNSIFPNQILSNQMLEFYDENKSQLISVRTENKVVAICPGSQHFTKMYPISYQIELAKELISLGFTVKLLGGKSDKEICIKIKSEVPEIIDKSNDNNLFELAKEICNSEYVICNDSGLMHLASAISQNVIAIFGSTVKDFGFAPTTPNVKIFEDNSVSCRPCSHIGKSKCPKKHFNCMNNIKPKMILDFIQSKEELNA